MLRVLANHAIAKFDELSCAPGLWRALSGTLGGRKRAAEWMLPPSISDLILIAIMPEATGGFHPSDMRPIEGVIQLSFRKQTKQGKMKGS